MAKEVSCEICHILSSNDLATIVFSALDVISARNAEIAGIRWPYDRILHERWGPVLSRIRKGESDEDTVSSTFDRKYARDVLFAANYARVLYFHFHDPKEMRDVTITLTQNGGFRCSQIVPIEVLSEKSTWEEPHGMSTDVARTVGRPWNVLDEWAPRFHDIGLVIITSDSDAEDGSWRIRRDALGDWLNAYLLTGGSVLQLMFSLCEGCHLSVGGAWSRLSRDALAPKDQARGTHLGLRECVSSTKHSKHPIFYGVETIDGGLSSFYATGAPSGDVLARWSNGAPLIVEKRHRGSIGTVFAMNAFPVSSDVEGCEALWDRSAGRNHFGRLLANVSAYALDETRTQRARARASASAF